MSNTTTAPTKTIKAISNGKAVAKHIVGAHKDYRWALLSIDVDGKVRFSSCRSATGREALLKDAVTFTVYAQKASLPAKAYLVLPIVDGIVLLPSDDRDAAPVVEVAPVVAFAAPAAEPAAPTPAASLATEQERIEVRDAATAAWAEASDASDLYCRACAVESAMKELGLKCRTNGNWGASCFVSVYLADHLGNLLTLEWDPMQDGFEIDEEPPAHLMSDRTAGDWVSPPTRQDQLEGRG